MLESTVTYCDNVDIIITNLVSVAAEEEEEEVEARCCFEEAPGPEHSILFYRTL